MTRVWDWFVGNGDDVAHLAEVQTPARGPRRLSFLFACGHPRRYPTVPHRVMDDLPRCKRCERAARILAAAVAASHDKPRSD